MSTVLAAFVAALLSFTQPYANSHDRILTQEDTMCLTEAIYHEARGERDGGIAMAYVAMNRVVLKKQTLCTLIHSKGQFSYYNPSRPKTVREHDAWKYSAYLAVYIQLGLIPNPIGNATSYNEHPMASWLDDMVYTKKVGNLYFYTLKTKLAESPLIKPSAPHQLPILRSIMCDTPQDNKYLKPPVIATMFEVIAVGDTLTHPQIERRRESEAMRPLEYVTVQLSPTVPFPDKPSLSQLQVATLVSAMTPTTKADFTTPTRSKNHATALPATKAASQQKAVHRHRL